MMNCLWNTVSFSIRKTKWKTLISPKSYTTSFPHKKTHLTSQFYSSYTDQQNSPLDYLDASDSETFDALSKNMLVVDNFITAEEEQSVYNEVQNYLKRLRYEVSHWDDVSMKSHYTLRFFCEPFLSTDKSEVCWVRCIWLECPSSCHLGWTSLPLCEC